MSRFAVCLCAARRARAAAPLAVPVTGSKIRGSSSWQVTLGQCPALPITASVSGREQSTGQPVMCSSLQSEGGFADNAPVSPGFQAGSVPGRQGELNPAGAAETEKIYCPCCSTVTCAGFPALTGAVGSAGHHTSPKAAGHGLGPSTDPHGGSAPSDQE